MDSDKFAMLKHHHEFGAKGTPPSERVTAEDRGLEPFQQPSSAAWDQMIAPADLSKLLLGFAPQDMDDKWFIYTVGPDEQGTGIVRMYRSWTGFQMIEAKFAIEPEQDGKVGAGVKARFTEITWEDSKERYNADMDAEAAKELARNVCAWCMDVELS